MADQKTGPDEERRATPDRQAKPGLHIFVNRRKFDETHGVQPVMIGRQLAGLVDVPAENAVVRRDSGGDRSEIGLDQSIDVKNGDHFLVTRRTVEGGHGIVGGYAIKSTPSTRLPRAR